MIIYTIIVTYNGAIWIEKCLRSLIKSGIKDHHIIVVDNQSSDNTCEIINENFDNISLIINSANLGFGKANNIGILKALKAGADFIFLLNQDAWIEKGSLVKLVEVAIESPKYGIISPLHFSGQMDFDRNFIKRILPNKSPQLIYNAFNNELRDIYSVEFVNAAAWLISRKCIEQVGIFEPLFKHYGEDENYISRCGFHGFSVGIAPKVAIIHDRKQQKKKYKGYNSMKDLLEVSKIKVLLNIQLKRNGVLKAYCKNLILKTGVYFSFYTLLAQITSEMYILFNLRRILKARKNSKTAFHEGF